jgi:hypothetical protein
MVMEQLVLVLADHFLAGKAENGDGGVVDEGANSFQIHTVDTLAGGVEQQFVPLR